MLDLLSSIALSIAGALVIALVFGVAGPHRARIGPLVGGLLLLLLYWAVIVASAELQHRIPGLQSLQWNWVGKAVTIAGTLVMVAAVPPLGPEGVGLQFKQAPRSLIPAVLCMTLLCALSWGVEALANDGRDISLERLAFQSLMPGLDEELFFRGVFLTLLSRAFQQEWTLLGAKIDPGALIVTFVFAAGHGLTVHDGRLHLDAQVFCLTGALGFGLLWIRRRTGSLLLPALAHNAINVGNSFF